LCVSKSDDLAILRKFACCAGKNRPKPSAMFRVADDEGSLI